MGIKSLTYLIKTKTNDSIEHTNLKNLSGKRVAIDASLFIYQSLINIRKGGDTLRNKKGQSISHLSGIFNKTINLLSLNITPIYIFDGKPPKEKQDIIDIRKKNAADCTDKLKTEKDPEQINLLKKKSVRITYEHIKEIKEMLNLIGVSYVHMQGEAEGLASELCRLNYVDYVMTEDMDSLVFGCPRLIRKSINKNNRSKDDISIFNLDTILTSLNITHEQFVELCILCGCDYCPSIPRIGNITAYKLIHKHKNIDTIIKNSSEKYDFPENYMEKFEISKKLFNIFKDKIPVDSIDIHSSTIDKKLLNTYLANIFDYNKNKIDNIFNKLKI